MSQLFRSAVASFSLFALACGSDGSADAGGEATTTDDSGSEEASSDTGAECSAVAPTAATEMITMNSAVCEPGNVLTEDGAVVGIGYPTNGDQDAIDGVDIVGCVSVDFEEERFVEEVRIVARAVEGACGSTCLDDCGTGDTLDVFYGLDGSTWTHAGDEDLTTELSSVVQSVDDQARYILVCRSGWGYMRDDIEVDYVEACAL